jgi:1-phosphofructokinase family hexose kinase
MATAGVVAVSTNPAIDRLAVVPDARAGGVRRATQHLETAGGKGAHVVAVAGTLGAAAWLVTAADERFRALLHVPATVVPCARTRGTYTIVDADGGDVLEVHEPGGPVPAEALLREAVAAVAGARVAVCAGSLAPGVPADVPARIVAAAGGFTVVDTSDREALRAALAAGPDLVKPNLAEARALLGDAPAPELAARLRGAGARAAWVSLGAEGSVLATPDGSWRLRGPATAVVNAVGAGDALVGGLAAGVARGLPLLDAARLGVAAATDKVGRLGFDAVEAAAVERLLPRVTAEPL